MEKKSFNLSINIICLSGSEQSAKHIAEQLSSQKSDVNGLYTNIINENFLVVYPRWPNCSKSMSNTAVSDAIVIYANSLDEYRSVESYLKSKERVNLLVFISECDDLKGLTSEYKNSKFFKKGGDITEIRDLIIEETKGQSITIRKIFDSLDTDKSGYLEKKEILNFARDKGDNVSSQEFVDTLNLIDRRGLGKICFEDFEKWWKMGGHTNSLFARLIRINDFSRGVLLSDEKFQLLQSELKSSQGDLNDISSHLIKLFSKEAFQTPGFQIFSNILIGGTDKENAKNIYLQRFSEDHFNQNKNSTWFQISLNVDSNDAPKIAKSIRFLKTTLLEQLEKKYRSAVSFVRSFFEIEEKAIGSIVLLTFKLKIDLQDFFENAVLPILQFFDLFTSSFDTSSQFLFDLQTKLTLEEMFSKNMSIKEALQSYTLEIKVNMIRSHIRKIVKSFKLEKELAFMLWVITSSSSVDMSCQTEIEHCLKEERLDFKLGFLGEIIDYFLKEYEFAIPFIKKITSLEFALNFNKMFVDMRMKLRNSHNNESSS